MDEALETDPLGILYSDDLAPNDGAPFYPEEDEDQANENSADRAMVLSALPMIDSLVEWLDGEIAMAATVEGIDLESNVPAESQILAKQVLKREFEASKSRLLALRDAHAKQA